MTHLCCDVVDFEGDVVSVVNGPKDQSHGIAEADEDQLFDRSAAFHFEMISAIAYGAPPERQAIYRERLRDIAGFDRARRGPAAKGHHARAAVGGDRARGAPAAGIRPHHRQAGRDGRLRRSPIALCLAALCVSHSPVRPILGKKAR